MRAMIFTRCGSRPQSRHMCCVRCRAEVSDTAPRCPNAGRPAVALLARRHNQSGTLGWSTGSQWSLGRLPPTMGQSPARAPIVLSV